MITKENYYLFSLIEKLYEDIKNCNVFVFDDIEMVWCETREEVVEKRLQYDKWNKDLQKQQSYNPQRLFRDGVIEWHCDDFYYDDSSILKIAKDEDTFIVTFEKSKVADPFYTYSVRIRNSGSRYELFNQLFMRMYNKLIEYNPSALFFHIEEYLYQKRLKKGL